VQLETVTPGEIGQYFEVRLQRMAKVPVGIAANDVPQAYPDGAIRRGGGLGGYQRLRNEAALRQGEAYVGTNVALWLATR
jgi:hypothetical protein